MKKRIARLILLMLVAFGLSAELDAQAVPSSVEKEIGKQLSCEARNKDISAVKLGPVRRGYAGQCFGGGEALLYEKTTDGISRVFENSTQMNGSMFLGKKTFRGYYEVNIEGHGARYLAVTTFRWNGSKFVRSRCEECDLDSNGNSSNCRPC